MPLSTLLTHPGTILLTLTQLSYSLGAFLADFNETHIYNPHWPPHAKFHNGQTMSLGVLLALTSLTHLYRSTDPSRGVARRKEDVWWAAVVGSLYCAAGLSAIWYPDAAWFDPEFGVEGQWTQKGIFGAVVGLCWVGYGLEARRLG